MKQSIIYALDFDGVICDSALETGISGWKAAIQIWDDFPGDLPSEQIIDSFRQIRPIMGTGYEAILIVRLLNDGVSVQSIINNFHIKKNDVIKNSNLQINALKTLFGETRDHWIKADLDDWVRKNPLFPGVAEKLQHLSAENLWYIVTTKQERFVKQILNANQVQLADDCIFGLDQNKSKEAILIELIKKHTTEDIYFVEDMLSSLLKVLNNSQLDSVKLILASWGYNTEEDKLKAKNNSIKLIDFDSFLTD